MLEKLVAEIIHRRVWKKLAGKDLTGLALEKDSGIGTDDFATHAAKAIKSLWLLHQCMESLE